MVVLVRGYQAERLPRAWQPGEPNSDDGIGNRDSKQPFTGDQKPAIEAGSRERAR